MLKGTFLPFFSVSFSFRFSFCLLPFLRFFFFFEQRGGGRFSGRGDFFSFYYSFSFLLLCLFIPFLLRFFFFVSFFRFCSFLCNDCVSVIKHIVSSTVNPTMTTGWGGPLFIWQAQDCTTPSELRKLVVPMREVRKLCANNAQTMCELIVPVSVNVDTDG